MTRVTFPVVATVVGCFLCARARVNLFAVNDVFEAVGKNTVRLYYCFCGLVVQHTALLVCLVAYSVFVICLLGGISLCLWCFFVFFQDYLGND